MRYRRGKRERERDRDREKLVDDWIEIASQNREWKRAVRSNIVGGQVSIACFPDFDENGSRENCGFAELVFLSRYF